MAQKKFSVGEVWFSCEGVHIVLTQTNGCHHLLVCNGGSNGLICLKHPRSDSKGCLIASSQRDIFDLIGSGGRRPTEWIMEVGGKNYRLSIIDENDRAVLLVKEPEHVATGPTEPADDSPGDGADVG